MQRHSRDRKKPETYVAEPASVADGKHQRAVLQ